MRRHIYSAFGLTICSDVECNDLLPTTGSPDVYVRIGTVPETLQCAVGEGILYQSAPCRFLLNIAHVGRYLISDGSEILVEPAPEGDVAALRLFLFGAAFGALLHQRGVLPLHGSAIVTSRGAVVFTGLSGSGKSALACAFHRKGYPVLADEVCGIDTRTSPSVVPGNPYLLVWADTLRELGVDQLALQPVRPDLEKYIVPLGEGFAKKAVGLRAVYILDPVISELSGPTPIRGLAKIEALTQNIYRPHFVEHMNIRARQIKHITEIARHTTVSLIRRPRVSLRLAQLVDLLERDFAA